MAAWRLRFGRLSGVYTGNDARTRIVLKELGDKVADVAAMRALGFCVSIEHARYMADRFVAAGYSGRLGVRRDAARLIVSVR